MLGVLWIVPFFRGHFVISFLGGVVPVVNGHSTAIRLDDYYLSIIYGVCLVFGCREDVFAVLLDIVWGLHKPWFTVGAFSSLFC